MASRPAAQPANLADILERVLDKGIIIAGDIRVNLLDIELLTIKIRLLDRLGRQGPGDGHRLVAQRPDAERRASRSLADENRQLRERIEALEAGGGRSPVTEHGRQPLPLRHRPRPRPAALAGRPGAAAAAALDVRRAPRPGRRGQRRRPRGVRRGGAAPQPREPRVARGGRPRPRRRRPGGRRARPDGAAAAGHDLPRRRRRARPARRVARRPRAGAGPGRGARGVEREGLRARPHPRRPRPAAAPRRAGGAAYLQRQEGPRARPREADESSAAAVADEVHERLASRRCAEPAAPAPGPAAHRPHRARCCSTAPTWSTPRRRDGLRGRSSTALADRPPGRRHRRAPARGRRTPSRRWSSGDAPESAPRRRPRRSRRTAARSPWSTCSTGCSAPASCWPATS